MEITLALLKPHVLRNTYALRQLKALIASNFDVLQAKEVRITKEISECFYAEHKGKFFYQRLTSFMQSGPCYALILQSESCIQKWRQLMGPTKVFRAVYTEPDSIRALYGLSDTRNACHGSDSEASAMREIGILFPEFDVTRIRSSQANNSKSA
ncbi:nucleoside diphosphate kinase 6 [Drosophila grimshawi]|uniref:Nucleoside diphosphate kinase n=1 Tax=Drosophila grimshawi TaxID=7222 RepID=B4JL42_DROGR|nr:nucleoside diphosphate kinase 6 [Drosophila grimshawi]EDW00295.1 GH11937 [Drosophila grimshawi]